MQATTSISFSVKGIEMWTFGWQGQQSQGDCFGYTERDDSVEDKTPIAQERDKEMKGWTLDSCFNRSLMVTEKG